MSYVSYNQNLRYQTNNRSTRRRHPRSQEGEQAVSDPIRWDVSMTQDGIGRFVSYHDYAMKDEQCEALRARVAELEESLHLANGTAELAMWHRDIAEEALAKREAVAVPDLWLFLRDVLRQGAAIESQQGKQGYETFIAYIEAEAHRQAKKLRAILTASQQAKEKGQ